MFRLSFSRSLCDYLAAKVGGEVRRVELKLGPELAPGEKSPSGLYAVCKAATGWPLRIPMIQELADRWRHPTRVVRSCWLRKRE